MMNTSKETLDLDHLIEWLLDGDVAIQYQVHRDLLGHEDDSLRDRIAHQGWGAKFLGFRKPEGHWGDRFYQPKWISTHYTILDLKNLCISQDNHLIRESIAQVLDTLKGSDGGISPFGAFQKCDVCVNGMFLNYASYFKMPEEPLRSIVDFLLFEQMQDGGFNCKSNFGGATHSSVHSTIAVLEAIFEYKRNGYTYGMKALAKVEKACLSFLLEHRLFRSHQTGEIFDKKMLMLSYPTRWKYDILRALDYMQMAAVPYDPRMQDALDVLKRKRLRDGRWPSQAKHPGQTHFDMEKAGQPSRWNTLRALRVLKHFEPKWV
jgi:hypothetical protein